ncbi:aminotransferase class V-fold PLP-dependent enzyme [Nocardia brasiliensis]|uniref:aminotransferase class V-fold PLP-dependent enzyme n=1 Tax=Nocardia brasiliensis TaxID=37326 RepID=UPI0024547DB8|nr:aminotransferase class V-fold PLP-dependent enzyme [Nocardia brasiliensis]
MAGFIEIHSNGHNPRGSTRTDTFLGQHPEYAATHRIDELRRTEYSYLDRGGHTYLDYTGAGLAACAQYRAHSTRLYGGCYGNPHSASPASVMTTELIEHTRAAVYKHFNASPADYAVVFTANATAACKIVGESYPFGRATRCVLTADNHNSVHGIREFARATGARVVYVPIDGSDLRVTDAAVGTALGRRTPNRAPGDRPTRKRGLFAYPAQSNFTGVQHPLDWVDLAHDRGYDVLLDAAAYLPTNELDLSRVPADFVAVSWYKLFGYPTGIGCLIARRTALSRLHRPWFSGGTIKAASAQGGWHRQADGAGGFEDGTVNFLAIPDVEFGLRWLHEIGFEVIKQRTQCLLEWLLNRLTSLRHDSGVPLVRIYGPKDTDRRGAAVAFNILDPASNIVDERLVARESAAAGISLRTGCFCNPGAGEAAFGITRSALVELADRPFTDIDDYLTALNLPSGGAVRVSLGLVTNIEDILRFVDFVDTTYRNRRATPAELPPRESC